MGEPVFALKLGQLSWFVTWGSDPPGPEYGPLATASHQGGSSPSQRHEIASSASALPRDASQEESVRGEPPRRRLRSPESRPRDARGRRFRDRRGRGRDRDREDERGGAEPSPSPQSSTIGGEGAPLLGEPLGRPPVLGEARDPGTISSLLVDVLCVMGQLIGVQLLLALNIAVFGANTHVAPCGSSYLPTACAVTEACVHLAPLLSLLVLLALIARMLVRRRFYYQLLKRNVVLEYQPQAAWQDPLFWVLSFCAVMAVAHFVLRLSGIKQDKDTVTMLALTGVYSLPLLWFMAQLAAVYDTESGLLSLSLYFEDDPEAAREALSETQSMKEAAAVTAALQLTFAGHKDKPCTMDDVVGELVGRHEANQPEPEGSRWRLISSLWPARVLLDQRLADEESRHFRSLWLCFSLACLTCLSCGLVHFLWSMATELRGLFFHAQWFQIAGILASLCGLVLCVQVAVSLMTQSRMFAQCAPSGSGAPQVPDRA